MTEMKEVSLITLPEAFKAFIVLQLKKIFGIEEVDVKVERPPKPELGDLAVPLHFLAKELKKSPKIIAAEFVEKAKEELPSWIHTFFDVNGYVNITVHPEFLAQQILLNPEKFMCVTGLCSEVVDQKVMVEFLSPNTNKPLHLGHVRNALLGDSVVRILRYLGFTVIAANLLNDRGVHICKSMIAYLREFDGKTPDTIGIKGDHLIGRCYVLFEGWLKNELQELYREKYDENLDVSYKDVEEELLKESSLANEAQAMLKKWEEEDPEVRALWQRLDEWVLAGFEETLQRLGIRHDKIYRESVTYLLGREVVERGLALGLFERREDGAVIIDLPKHDKSFNNPKVLVRPDGTTVYMTQDLGTANLKEEDFGLAQSIYVVADEQNHHFRVLFTILKLLGYPWAKGLYHLSYGMVELPHGRMKSREGTVIDADDLMEEVVGLASVVTKEKFGERGQEISEEELAEIAEMLGIGALKFHFLSSRPTSRIKFNPDEAVKFEGKTGPFVSYVFARIQSMLNKGNFDAMVPIDTTVLVHSAERLLLKKLSEFHEVVLKAADKYDPSLLADFAFELAQTFNSFYNTRECKVIEAETEELRQARLMLSYVTARVIEKTMELLGISVPERM